MEFGSIELTECLGIASAIKYVEFGSGNEVDMLRPNANGMGATTVIDETTVTIT